MIEFMQASHEVQFLVMLFMLCELIVLMILEIVQFHDAHKAVQKVITALLILYTFVLICTMTDNYHYHNYTQSVKLWYYLVVELAIFIYLVWKITQRIKKGSRTIGTASIRQAIDHLPVGVCYFEKSGAVKLCNNRMYQIFSEMTGKSDLQSLDQLHAILAKDGGKGDPVYILKDKTALIYSEQVIMAADGRVYTESLFTDVTLLNQKKEELALSLKELRAMNRELKVLRANAKELAREEEIMNATTRLHDQMGAGLLAIRRGLLQEASPKELRQAVNLWEKTVQTLRAENIQPQLFDDYEELVQDARVLGVEIHLQGELPGDRSIRNIVMLAAWECLTNAVRHADATQLMISIKQTDGKIICEITNDGQAPTKDIVPGGGLKNLMMQAQSVGAKMHVYSRPQFKLTISARRGDQL
ncbi:MAG: hypothetical protein K6G01_09715 [Eubacterium sp.]|nr:hypothetical protein [Eubacterium sp.]